MKPKVLLVAQKEINNKTDISFDFEEIKTGRKVTSLKFYINTNKTKSKVLDEVCATTENKSTDGEEKFHTELISKVKSIFKENISGLEAKSILDAAKGDINIIKEKYEIAKVTPRIDGIVGWMCDAIKRDYQQLKGKVKNGSFNDYEQRAYDGKDGGMTYKSLENQLLGWKDNEKDEVGEEFQQGKY
jgi:plasmid replication initiation protein